MTAFDFPAVQLAEGNVYRDAMAPTNGTAGWVSNFKTTDEPDFLLSFPDKELATAWFLRTDDEAVPLSIDFETTFDLDTSWAHIVVGPPGTGKTRMLMQTLRKLFGVLFIADCKGNGGSRVSCSCCRRCFPELKCRCAKMPFRICKR